jgi:hypothetical protein
MQVAALHKAGDIGAPRISRRRFVEVGVIHHAGILTIEILLVNHIMKDIFK